MQLDGGMLQLNVGLVQLIAAMVQLVTGELFVENLLAAMLLGTMIALWSFGESGQRRFLCADRNRRRRCGLLPSYL